MFQISSCPYLRNIHIYFLKTITGPYFQHFKKIVLLDLGVYLEQILCKEDFVKSTTKAENYQYNKKVILINIHT